MDEPRWLTRRIVDVIHFELIREHGGATGLREGGDDLIESALARPRNQFVYAPDADPASLGAAYLFGLVKNHGYIDGNKRVAFASAAIFLRLNGVRLTAGEPDAYDAVVGAVEGRYTEEDLAAWIRTNCDTLAD